MGEERRKPFMTTQETDIAAFSAERSLFLADYTAFRAGKYLSGELALNHLIAMFYTLPATRYFNQNPTDATAFLSSIDELQNELNEYPSKNRINVDGRLIIPEMIKKMDLVVRKFHEILYTTGYSGG